MRSVLLISKPVGRKGHRSTTVLHVPYSSVVSLSKGCHQEKRGARHFLRRLEVQSEIAQFLSVLSWCLLSVHRLSAVRMRIQMAPGAPANLLPSHFLSWLSQTGLLNRASLWAPKSALCLQNPATIGRLHNLV